MALPYLQRDRAFATRFFAQAHSNHAKRAQTIGAIPSAKS